MTKIRNLLIGIAAFCLLIGSMLLLPWGKDMQKVYAAEAPAVSVRGDLNADGVVNLDDVIILRQYLAGMIELTDEQIEAGDVYGGDAEITLDDVIVMRQYLAGIQVEGGIGEPMEHVHTLIYHEGKAATCTEAGWRPYETCTECDYTTYQEIAPLGHELIEHEAKPATCAESGWDAYVTCIHCDYTTYQEIVAKGHSPAESVRENEKAATCTEAGSYDEVVYCSVCGIELSRESKTIAELGHDLIEHEAKPATCTESGWDAYVTCTRCDYTTYQEIPAKGHVEAEAVRENEKSATCTEAGSYDEVVYCSVCGIELSREGKTIDKLGHDLVEYEAKSATCTEPGWEAYVTCTRCDYTTYQEIAAKGHAPAEAVRENEKAATCTEAGSYDEVVYCSVCGIELSREGKTIDKLDHDLVEHEAKPATCTEPGWDAYVTCTRCDYTTYQEIAALDHVYEEAEIVTEPTCESDGVRKLSCVRCGDVVQEVIPAIDHNIQNNKCTMCGRELPGYYNGTYGYEFLGAMDKGDARQSLYEDIDVKVKSFHISTYKDAPEDLVLASVDYASLGLSIDEAISVWKTYKDDNPLYYWLSNTTYVEDGGIVLMVEEAYAAAEVRENYNQLIDAKVQEYSAQLNDGANAYDIALAYHDAILYAVDYTYDENNEPEDASWAHNVIGVFAEQGAVCEAYARTFQLLLNYSGIENVFVTGDGNGEEHAWNLVRLDDGNWYWCDLTWDDTFVGGLNSTWKWGISYNYFMVNDTQNTLIAEGGWEYGEEIAFLENHKFDTSTNTGTSFLYDLPARNNNVYTSENLMLRDEIVVGDMLLQVVGYNALELHKVTASGSFDIPETVQYDGREMKIISLGSGDSEQISDAVTSITIPESVIFIWDFALGDDAIGNIYVDANNPKFTSQDGVLFTKSLYTLIQYPSANIRTEYVIPDETHIVAYGAFNLCANLSKLTFGKNVEGVGLANWGGGYPDGDASGWFGGNIVNGEISRICDVLAGDKQIIIDPENRTYASDDFAIYSYSKTAILYIYNKSISSYCVPATITSIEEDVFSDCIMLESFTVEPGHPTFNVYEGILYNKNLTEIIAVPKAIKGDITIPENVTEIGNRAFWGCSDLTSIVIPEEVTSIGNHAFYNCSSLMSIIIPEGVTNIGDSAFWGCSNLTSIAIPEKVISIGDHAFYNCCSLESIIIPEGVTSISDWVFADCSNLTSLTIPECVTSIGEYALYNCSSLTSIVIPENVTNIGDNAFDGCSGLTSIMIPKGVTSIGDGAFLRCSSLTNIVIPEGVTSIGDGAFSGCSGLTSIMIPEGVTSIGEHTFSGCSSLTNIVIPKGVTGIGGYAFSDCSNLTNVKLQKGVASIGENAFYNCSSLTSITIPEGITSISDDAFYNCSSLESITIPEGVTSIGYGAFSGCSSLTNIEISDSLTSIGDWAFYGCSSLESITIPKTVTGIGSYAFCNCSSLSSIIIPNGVIYIGSFAFDRCVSMTSAVIGSKVANIGASAFYRCYKLIEVYNYSDLDIQKGSTEYGYIGYYAANIYTSTNQESHISTTEDGYVFYSDENVCCLMDYIGSQIYLELPNDKSYSIHQYAFSGCKNIKSISIPDVVTSIGDRAFYHCSDLTSISIGGGVTEIGLGIFEGCSNLLSIMVAEENPTYFSEGNCIIELATNDLVVGCGNSIIPDGVRYIMGNAFAGCDGLSSLILPEGVKYIGGSAFADCSNLVGIVIPSTVISIGAYAFQNCISLTHIDMSNCAAEIGSYAFLRCSSLKSIMLPEGIESIEYGMFSGCDSLTDITIPDSVNRIAGDAFRNCSALQRISIPEGVTLIEDGTFYGCSSLSNISIPNSVTSIGVRAFYNCSELTDIVIPEGVTAIGWEAFHGCSSLSSIVIPNGVTSIEQNTFFDCSSLKSIIIGDHVTSIGYHAFSGCSGLTSITIPTSVLSIGYYAFSGCSNLTSIEFQYADGWYISTNADAVEGIQIASANLSNPAKAAELLKDTYSNYYWKNN